MIQTRFSFCIYFSLHHHLEFSQKLFFSKNPLSVSKLQNHSRSKIHSYSRLIVTFNFIFFVLSISFVLVAHRFVVDVEMRVQKEVAIFLSLFSHISNHLKTIKMESSSPPRMDPKEFESALQRMRLNLETASSSSSPGKTGPSSSLSSSQPPKSSSDGSTTNRDPSSTKKTSEKKQGKQRDVDSKADFDIDLNLGLERDWKVESSFFAPDRKEIKIPAPFTDSLKKYKDQNKLA